MSLSLSINLSLYLSLSLYIYLSISLSLYQSLSLSIYLSLYLSIYVSIYLSPPPPLYIYLSISISLSLSLSQNLFVRSSGAAINRDFLLRGSCYDFISLSLSVSLSLCLSLPLSLSPSLFLYLSLSLSLNLSLTHRRPQSIDDQSTIDQRTDPFDRSRHRSFDDRFQSITIAQPWPKLVRRRFTVADKYCQLSLDTTDLMIIVSHAA